MSVGVEERVDSLEALFGHFMATTGAALNRLERSEESFRREMKEFKDEMKEFKDEMKEFREEERRSRIDMNKRWGELANKMGTIVEDIVAPNIPHIAKTYFGVEKLDFFGIRIQKAHPKGDGKKKEFDVIAVSKDYLFLNETKSTPRRNYLDEFAEEYRLVFEYFPEYKGKILIPIFSSLSLPEEVVSFLTKHGIFAMAMTGETMELLNYDKVMKKQ